MRKRTAPSFFFSSFCTATTATAADAAPVDDAEAPANDGSNETSDGTAEEQRALRRVSVRGVGVGDSFPPYRHHSTSFYHKHL